MFDSWPASMLNPLARALIDVDAGVPVSREEVAIQIRNGWVDVTVVPPILTAEGKQFLNSLSPNRR